MSSSAEKKLGSRTPVDKVTLPPYYPNHPDILRDWAAYLDSVRMTDVMVGEVMARLEKEGIRETTLIIFMTDHGISHARGKQFLYDEGTHVPLVISGPGIEAGSTRTDVVEHIDISAISLAAAGIRIPEHMQARNILANDYSPRKAVFSARDRCDETVDHIRSVRTESFKYIRNFLPERPYLQPCRYKDAKSILIALRDWNAKNKLNSTQKLIFRETRPTEELYDLTRDPHEIKNLAVIPEYADKLKEMRRRLNRWMRRTNDQGQIPETTEMYDSDMEVYLQKNRNNPDSTQLRILEKNIAQMKQWASEGK